MSKNSLNNPIKLYYRSRVWVVMEEEIKTFKDLTREVIEKEICVKCGGCISFCLAGELNALEMRKNEVPRYINQDNCPKCGMCYFICPQTDTSNVELRTRSRGETQN
jgi:coenzyme F420 hydrogenase subunit beta